jgi:anaerobic selenocysteine-containing dehydrogenase
MMTSLSVGHLIMAVKKGFSEAPEGRRVVFLNAGDIRERGLHEGQWVDLVSHDDGQKR